MRIVFMGTPDFAVPALRALIDAGHDIAAVYSQPPRPSGRGQKLQKSPVHTLAEEHGIPVRTPVNFKSPEDREAIKDLNADIGVVAAYGLILPQAVLDAPRLGCLNIHGSLLPRWRGAAPIHRAILAGDTQTGITIMRMEAGLDTGPMLHKEYVDIKSTDTTRILHDHLSSLGARMIVEVVNDLNAFPEIVQPENGVTYAHKIAKSEGVLCSAQNAQQIELMLRAFTPWPPVMLVHLRLLSGFVQDGKTDRSFGTFLNREGDLACADGTVIRITHIQSSNGRAMTVADAINGGLITL